MWFSLWHPATSTTSSYAKILGGAIGKQGEQPAKTTTIAYREHLGALWILDPVPGWSASNNPVKRLVQAPKHHLADPPLAARLLDRNENTLLSARGRHLLGPLFESLATLTLRVAAEALRAKVFHLRTQGGEHEVDLIVEGADGELLAVEIKLAQNIVDSDVKHLVWLREQFPDRQVRLLAINTGARAYRRADGVYVVPLSLLGL